MGSESQLVFLYFWDVSHTPPSLGVKACAQNGVSGSYMDAVFKLVACKE